MGESIRLTWLSYVLLLRCNVNFRSAALDDDIESSVYKTSKSLSPKSNVTCTTLGKALLNQNSLEFVWERQ